MRADLLHVVAVYANPVRWASRLALQRAFEQHMLESGVRLTTVECGFGDRPFDLEDHPGINRVRVRARTLVWSKENLLNIAISRLPPDWQYVATLDADIVFRKPGWAAETVHALQQYHAVQPWSDCYDLGPNDDHLEAHRSFCRLVQDDEPIMQGPQCGPCTPYRFGHPGYAWAWSRQALEWVGGLVETAALGAADHHMALALIGRVGDSIPDTMTEGYKKPLYRWQSRAMQHIAGNISYVPGTIEHGWHGSKGRRAYISRWDILIQHQFDPDTDLKKNTFGVVELAGNKPRLTHGIDRYFRSRSEDANCL